MTPRFALYGGSFDPIHRGHLEVAGAAAALLGLPRVVFLPAARPPHKPGRVLTSPYHRFALVAASIVGRPWAEVSPWELERPGTTFAFEQVAHFSTLGEPTLFLGADSLADFPSWVRAEELAATARIAVLPREPHIEPAALAEKLPEWLASRIRVVAGGESAASGHLPGEILWVPVPPITISATALRARLSSGEPVEDDIAAPALELIRRHRLYGTGDRTP